MPAILTATTAVFKSMSLAGVAETVSATEGVEMMSSRDLENGLAGNRGIDDTHVARDQLVFGTDI